MYKRGGMGMETNVVVTGGDGMEVLRRWIGTKRKLDGRGAMEIKSGATCGVGCV